VVSTPKEKGKRKKAKGRKTDGSALPFSFCLVTFSFSPPTSMDDPAALVNRWERLAKKEKGKR
jgi:hypothetical protein